MRTIRMPNHRATRHRRGKRRGTKKRRATFHPNVGTIYPYANTYETGNLWNSWRVRDTLPDLDHWRRRVPRGSRNAVTARWIERRNSGRPYRRTTIANYPPDMRWTRGRTENSRRSLADAAARGRMLRNHLNALEQGRNNGQGGTIRLPGDQEQELVNLIVKKLLGVLSPEEQARHDELYARKHGH